ncbi:hypothetical protein NKR23_g12320, partial [Pleurostoma richardsiae]
MPPSKPSDGPSKLPAIPDQTQFFNRVSLAIAKHSAFLDNIRARNVPRSTNASNTTNPPSGAGFSSLSSSSSAAAATTRRQPPPGPHARARTEEEEAQFAELRGAAA